MELTTQVQTLDVAVYISFQTNALGLRHESICSPPP